MTTDNRSLTTDNFPATLDLPALAAHADWPPLVVRLRRPETPEQQRKRIAWMLRAERMPDGLTTKRQAAEGFTGQRRVECHDYRNPGHPLMARIRGWLTRHGPTSIAGLVVATAASYEAVRGCLCVLKRKGECTSQAAGVYARIGFGSVSQDEKDFANAECSDDCSDV